MLTILLDTSVMLDHLNGRSGRTAYLAQLVDEGYLVWVAVRSILLKSTQEYEALKSLRVFFGDTRNRQEGWFLAAGLAAKRPDAFVYRCHDRSGCPGLSFAAVD